MTHVVVIGAGVAGVPAAYALKSRLGPKDEVTVISDRDYFHFVPSNPWIAMGWRDRRDIAFPIGPYLKEHGIQFIGSGVKRIHPDRTQVDLENGGTLFYDYLLLASGAEADFDEVPGMREHTHSVIHIEQAERAFAAYREFAKHPGPIVVGAVQGSGILGPVYEYAFLADADLKRRGVRNRVPITLVTPEPYPGHLGLGAEAVTRKLVENALAENRIDVICNARTLQVEAGVVYVAECDEAGNVKKEHQLPYGYSVYWPAFRGVAGVRPTAGICNERGLVNVDAYLKTPAHANIFAVGVCVAHERVEVTAVPVGAPDSVYSIQNEVNTAVTNLVASIRGEALESAVPERAKWLGDMGESGAAYLSEPQVPLRNINWMRQGRWVHQAKVDFEKYFVNKLKLKPAAHAPSVASKIAGVMTRLVAARGEGTEAAVPALVESPTAPALEVRLPKDPCFDLRALARSLGREPAVFATELLEAAVADAKAYLGEPALDAMEQARRELFVAELPENQPGVEFHGGGT